MPVASKPFFLDRNSHNRSLRAAHHTAGWRHLPNAVSLYAEQKVENRSWKTCETGKTMRTLNRVLKICLLIFALGAVVAAVWPQARLAAVWAAGRCQECSFHDAVNSHALLVNMTKAGEEVGLASKVIQTDPRGFELVATPMGQYWTVPGDRFLKFTLGEEKLEIYDGEDVAVRPGDVVLDCGANVGVFTRTALNRGARLVVAIEPSPRTVECLRRNFEKEIAGGRVIVVPKGVWDHPDILELADGRRRRQHDGRQLCAGPRPKEESKGGTHHHRYPGG